MGVNGAIPKLPSKRGTYLRNCWYVAGWSDDLTDTPQAKVFLEEPVALFRDRDGVAMAIGGRCPHRFAALGDGSVIDGALACPYHGLRFDGSGVCIHNPHLGDPPPKATVPAYPLVERYRLLWIWMGDADKADTALIPNFAWLDDPAWEAVRGVTLAEGHYELYSDNILDLSHANFVHPALVASAFTQGERKFWQDETHAYSRYTQKNDYISPALAGVLGVEGRKQDFFGEVTWHAPATLFFDYRAGEPGTSVEDMKALLSLHAFTPETPDTTHYVWATSRDYKLGDTEFSEGLHAALSFAFEHEDLPVIRDAHRLMAGQDFWDLEPLVLNGDGGGVRARRLLNKMIKFEASNA